MAPGDVAHVPRTPSPVAGAGPVARHFRSRARLRRLLVRLRRPTPSTPALRATPGGASLTTFGFVTTVPRYLPEASNSLTFVRGADRACRAPRKRRRSLICAPRKRFGRACQSFACAGRRATPKGVERAPGSGILPPLCVIERREERGCRGAPCRGVVKAGARSPRPCDGEGAGIFPQKKREDAQSGRCPAGPRLPGLIGSITV